MTMLSYLRAELDKAHRNYKTRNPSSAKAYGDSSTYLPGGNTRSVLHSSPFPLTIISAKGPNLESLDGHSYLDYLSDYSAALFGHSNERISDGVQRVLSDGWGYGAHNLYEKELARLLCQRFQPSGMEMVRFTNSGTEANIMAIATAVAATGRKKILVFSNAYHGGPLSFPMAWCQDPKAYPSINLPYEFVPAPFNNIGETQDILANLPVGEDNFAAILVEPLQGAAGCRPAMKDFMQFLRGLADDTGALLIVDEVMTSRLALGGLTSEYGIRADLMTVGKWVGGGMTLGAFGGRRDLMELYNPITGRLTHSGTYNNNVFSMAAGIIGMDIYTREVLDIMNTEGNFLRSSLHHLLCGKIPPPDGAGLDNDFSSIMEIDSIESGSALFIFPGCLDGYEPTPPIFVTGRGTVFAVRFGLEHSQLWQELYLHHMLENGIYLAPRGFVALSTELTEVQHSAFFKATEAFVLKHRRNLWNFF
ncbi:hypothetical protein FQN57_000542 [Myotisia sp. PD_48]|nr:hypothetical protein FQN57_000542 [Myotisia sp. PD_48]